MLVQCGISKSVNYSVNVLSNRNMSSSTVGTRTWRNEKWWSRPTRWIRNVYEAGSRRRRDGRNV